jgi:uncharacterized membrane protein
VLARTELFGGQVILLHSGNVGDAPLFPWYVRPWLNRRSLAVRQVYLKAVPSMGGIRRPDQFGGRDVAPESAEVLRRRLFAFNRCGLWIMVRRNTKALEVAHFQLLFQNRANGLLMTKARQFFLWWLALFFIAAGANHFRVPEVYLGMMPGWLPWPTAMNEISGTAEILGGSGLLVPRLRHFTGWGLIALLVAVFPANVHVALQGWMPGTSFSPLVLWLRLPLQPVLMAWVWWVAISRVSKV